MQFNYQGNSKSSGIYKILNTHNSRVYIGQAREFKERWKGHSSSLLNGKHQNKFLQADFNKCRETLGHTDFLEFHILEVMESSTKEERGVREEHWIAQWFDGGKQCYNLTEKAVSREGCPSRNPDETRKKQRERMKAMWADTAFRERMLSVDRSGENSASWGRKHTPDALEKIKAARALQVCSEETKTKMSIAHTGKKCEEITRQKIGEKNSLNMKELWQDPQYREKMIEAAGHEQTQETREKISKSMKGKKKSPETIEKMREARKKLWQDPEYRKRAQQHRN